MFQVADNFLFKSHTGHFLTFKREFTTDNQYASHKAL